MEDGIVQKFSLREYMEGEYSDYCEIGGCIFLPRYGQYIIDIRKCQFIQDYWAIIDGEGEVHHITELTPFGTDESNSLLSEIRNRIDTKTRLYKEICEYLAEYKRMVSIIENVIDIEDIVEPS